jgi:hypothetical protein
MAIAANVTISACRLRAGEREENPFEAEIILPESGKMARACTVVLTGSRIALR